MRRDLIFVSVKRLKHTLILDASTKEWFFGIAQQYDSAQRCLTLKNPRNELAAKTQIIVMHGNRFAALIGSTTQPSKSETWIMTRTKDGRMEGYPKGCSEGPSRVRLSGTCRDKCSWWRCSVDRSSGGGLDVMPKGKQIGRGMDFKTRGSRKSDRCLGFVPSASTRLASL